MFGNYYVIHVFSNLFAVVFLFMFVIVTDPHERSYALHTCIFVYIYREIEYIC
jgi:hypothetical protein